MKAAFLAFTLIVFSGCVAGQKLPYAYTPANFTAQKVNGPVDVLVKDERPFILDGDKEPSYVGHFRGGYGNTWDVKTEDEIALAQQFQNDLQKELRSLGAETPSGGARKTLRVTIEDYNFDAYINIRFWYKFKVEVYDAQNHLLEQSEVATEKSVKGSFWIGPAHAFKKQTPVLHSEIIRSLVRDNGKILKALQD